MSDWHYLANLKPSKNGLKRNQFSRPHIVIFVMVFGLIGVILWRSFAAPNPSLPGDINGDNVVDATDLSILLSDYGTTNSAADINGDGIVNVVDLSILLSHYGQTYSGGGTSQIASVEAESMTPTPSGNGVSYSDATASGGQARSLWGAGTMFGSINLPTAATSVKVIASGDTCNTNQHGTIGLSIDSSNLGSSQVTTQSWSTYTFTSNISAGTHTVTLNFTPPSACSDNLYVDVIEFFGSSTAPSVSLTASPTSITSGQSSTLTWSSANVTSCTASGAWSGSKATSGSQSVSPASTSTYTLTCSGTGGNANNSATVTVNSGGGNGSYIKGYYDQGPNMLTEWNSYKQYGFNMVIASIDTSLLTQIKTDGGTAWVQPNIWNGCSYAYSSSQALTYAQQAVATGAVSAFYVADEPSTSGCSTAPSQIATWTATLHQNFPGIPTVIATYDSTDLTDFAASADMFALDTYPCQNGNGCNYSWITQLAAAADSLGLKYVGVPQAFGGDGHYDLPTAAQLQQIIDTWRATKEVGYVIYAFSAEGMPTADYLQNQPALLSVIQAEDAK